MAMTGIIIRKVHELKGKYAKENKICDLYLFHNFLFYRVQAM